MKETGLPDERVYTLSPEALREDYTRRCLYQFNGFERLLGGFGGLEEAAEAKRGWVVLSYLERRWGSDQVPIPPNWALAFEAGPPKRWARVYRIVADAGLLAPWRRALLGFPEDRDALRVRPYAGSGQPDAEVLSVGETIRVRVGAGEAPMWLFFERGDEPGPRGAPLAVPEEARRVAFRVTLSVSRPVAVRLGVGRSAAEPTEEPPGVTYTYGTEVRVGTGAREVGFETRTMGPERVVPVLCFGPREACTLEIERLAVVADCW